MASRNPFETALNADGADVDIARQPPRDMMADAFISEVADRLMAGRRHGYIPGLLPHRGGYGGHHGRWREMNGFPVDHGMWGMHNTYSAASSYPAYIDPFGFAASYPMDPGLLGMMPYGGHGMMPYGGPFMGDPLLGVGDPLGVAAGAAIDETMVDLAAEDLDDPFAPSLDAADQFALDALPYGGPTDVGVMDAGAGMMLPAVPPMPSMPMTATDPGLDSLRRAVRPGYAELSTFGYSEPVADPYAENLTALLRRLVRQS